MYQQPQQAAGLFGQWRKSSNTILGMNFCVCHSIHFVLRNVKHFSPTRYQLLSLLKRFQFV